MHYFIIFLLSFLSSPPIADHEFHISKCEIAYNEADQAIQISMHIFIDDLEEALAAKGFNKLAIGMDEEIPEAEQYIADYLAEQFEISINDKSSSYSFLGKELSEDLQAIWCYLEIENITNVEQLKVRNQILTQTFEDQKNIISIRSSTNGRKGYFLFDGTTFEDTVSF